MFMKGRFWFWLLLLVLESAVLHSQASVSAAKPADIDWMLEAKELVEICNG